MPWNFGLSGKEYLKHYQKKDGSNSLYDSIKRNSSFFRKTLPEKKMEDILLFLSLKFEHPFFRKRKQFDFVIFLKNYRFIIEVDGDYWHKSSRRCSDPTIRRNQRDIDKRKEGVFKKIKSNKSWVVLRFWELDILNDSITVEKYIKELIKEDKKGNCESTIQKIKKYYRKKS
jgi:very-short-patch-repair endonuclease